MVIPGLVDTHTHVVCRLQEHELEMRSRVFPILIYWLQEEYTRYGSLHQSGQPGQLVQVARKYLDQMLAQGTTTAEAKNGYGLTVEDEVKTWRRPGLNNSHPVDPVPTFLGAHAIPEEYKENLMVC